jgi:hypothetical protein
VTRDVAPDPEITEILAYYRELAGPILEEVVGSSEVPILHGGSSVVRSGENRLGNLATDALTDTYDIDFAFQNSGGLRDRLTTDRVDEDGNYVIRRADVLAVWPFGNTVWLAEVNGEQLRQIIANGIRQVGGGRFMQVSGMRVEFHTDGTDGGFPRGVIHSVTYWGHPDIPDGTPVDLTADATYRVAMNDFMAVGGDGYPNIEPQVYFRDEGLDIIIANYLQRSSPVVPEVEGRLARLDDLATTESASVPAGRTTQLEAIASYLSGTSLEPLLTTTSDVTDRATWVSADEGIATVDEDGLVTGVAEGDTTITATFFGESDTTELTVEPAVLEGLAVEPSTLDLEVGESGELTATATYSDDSEADVTTDVEWSSSDEDVATVDADGVVTAVGEGEATITAELDGETATAAITVTEAPDPGEDGEWVRVAGTNRVRTAIAVSQATFADAGVEDDEDGRIPAGAVVLARSTDFADALAGTPLAVAVDAPVLLTPPNALDAEVLAEIERILAEGGTVHLLGGEQALSAAVADAVEDAGYVVDRIFGSTRFETSVAIAELLDPEQVLVTTGLRFPDALAAGAAAAANGGAVLLTVGDRPHGAVDDYLAEHDDLDITAVGGPAARAYPEATPVFGRERMATAVAVAQAFFSEPEVVGIARQGDYPDALAGGAHIGRLGGPILLTPTTTVAPVLGSYLCANASSLTAAFVYGGDGAVADDVGEAIAGYIAGEGCGDD